MSAARTESLLAAQFAPCSDCLSPFACGVPERCRKVSADLSDFCAECGHESKWHKDGCGCVAPELTHLPCSCPGFVSPDALAEYLEEFVRTGP